MINLHIAMHMLFRDLREQLISIRDINRDLVVSELALHWKKTAKMKQQDNENYQKRTKE